MIIYFVSFHSSLLLIQIKNKQDVDGHTPTTSPFPKRNIAWPHPYAPMALASFDGMLQARQKCDGKDRRASCWVLQLVVVVQKTMT
jgi:hypothetical protein